MALRVALFGQAQFGKDTLEGLLQRGHKVVGVFAPPEGARPDPLAERAKELDIPLIRRRYFRKKGGTAIPEAVEEYRALEAELNVLASVQVFIPSEITDAPKHKSICFHPSMLPAYRGGAVEAILDAVDLIDGGKATPQVQDESRATHQGLITDEIAAIDLNRPAVEIDRLVRGCDPQPGAFVRFEGNPVRLFDATFERGGDGEPGEIVAINDSGLTIALSGGRLHLKRVRADQGKEPASEFAKRAGLSPGQRFTSGS
jgi:methionyl-tRNA formyltransferase